MNRRPAIRILVLLSMQVSLVTVSHAAIRAGAAQTEVTLPVGLEIRHFFRTSVASLPNWGSRESHSRFFGPPDIGSEKIIQDTIAALWPEPEAEVELKPIQRAQDAPRPLSPEESATRVSLPKGLRIELVASEPIVAEPSCLAFDERGRLFVCELHGYNVEGQIDVERLNKTGILDTEVRRIRWELQGGPVAEEAKKRQYGTLKMLRDTNGDGAMDKADVWAEHLPPCYGVIPARGGVIVTCAPDILFFADPDGDGKPDVRKTLFTGFRTDVLERGINNPRWGLDNWIYVGAGGRGGTISGPNLSTSVELPHSDFRIKPDGSAIEPVNGRVGTFGLTVNSVGDRFPASGGRPATYALPLPNRYLARNPFVATPKTDYAAADYTRGYRLSQPHPWRVRRGQDPAWVKFYGSRETNSNYFSGGCSNEFYGDSLLPQEYRGSVFYCEPSLNIVHRCVVERDGAGYRGRRAPGEQESEFLASTDQWFRPMNLRAGPEGALYIVDMYREIIEDYSAIPRYLQQQYGLDQGRAHGRIWRLVPDDFAARPWEDFSQLDNVQLVRATADPIAWRRLTAQRLLIERNAKESAQTLWEQLRSDIPPAGCIHALYTLAGLGELQADHVTHALQHEDYRVRVHALRLAEPWLAAHAELLRQIVAMTADRDPSVRLQVAMTLGQSTDLQATQALLTLAIEHGNERWMDAAILSSSMERAGDLLDGLLTQESLNQAGRALLQPLAKTLAGERNPDAISRLLERIAGREPKIQIECLAGLAETFSPDEPALLPPASGWAPLQRLLKSESEEVLSLATQVAAALRSADSGQLQQIFARAAEKALDTQLKLEQRRQNLRLLSSAPFDLSGPIAGRLLESRNPLELQLAAAKLLGDSSDERAGTTLLENWPGYTPTVRDAVLKSVFHRESCWPALLDAIEKNRITPAEISANAREQLVSCRDPEIASRAKQLLENRNADKELRQRLATYQQALAGPRSIDRGRTVFVRNCLNCHKLGNEGYDVGPILGTITNKPDETVLMDLLDPSGRIEPEYRSYVATTDDGRIYNGILVSETPTSIMLRMEKGSTETLLRRTIDRITASQVSLMPSNLHEQISPQQAADLIAFLRQEFGKRGD